MKTMKRTAGNLFTVFVLLLDEIILVAIILFVLGKLGVNLRLGAIFGLVVILEVCSYTLYRFITPVLTESKLTACEGMVGLKGKVVAALTPDGYIKVSGELWKASSNDTNISIGEEVVVWGMEGLKLLVRRENNA